MKSYNPTTPTRRFMTLLSRDDITKQTPEKSLVEGKKRTGGRNSDGPRHVALHRRRPQAGLSR
jgi:large subunit ribosomal protein L2